MCCSKSDQEELSYQLLFLDLSHTIGEANGPLDCSLHLPSTDSVFSSLPYSSFVCFVLIFIYFWLLQVLVVAHGILCCGPRASNCGTRVPERVGSVVAAHRLSSYGTRAQLACGIQALSSLTRDRTQVPCIGRWILNHWTTREVPSALFFSLFALLTFSHFLSFYTLHSHSVLIFLLTFLCTLFSRPILVKMTLGNT